EQGVHGARRQRREGRVGGREDGERAFALEGVDQAGGLQRGGQGRELAGGHGGIDDVGLRPGGRGGRGSARLSGKGQRRCQAQGQGEDQRTGAGREGSGGSVHGGAPGSG